MPWKHCVPHLCNENTSFKNHRDFSKVKTTQNRYKNGNIQERPLHSNTVSFETPFQKQEPIRTYPFRH